MVHRLRAVEGDVLLFSSGHFLRVFTARWPASSREPADTIESARKERVLEASMEVPILLARLRPGTYTIRARSDATTLTRRVTSAAQGLRQVDFRWDASP